MNILLKKLSVLKGSISRAFTFISEPPDNTTVQEIITRITRLDDIWSKFEQCTSQLYSYESIEGYVDPESFFYSYEEKYISTKGKLEALRHVVGPRESTPDLNEAFSRFADQQSTLLQRVAEGPSTSRSELPKIRIEPFTGNYKDWPAFKDLFVSAIDSKTDLTNTQKFHYLSSLLKDDAAKLIRHMQVSDSSYTAAWNRLVERFDRPRHIVTSYLETFMSLKPVKEEDAVTLRKISDVTNEVIRGLDAINQNGRDPWVVYLLNNKLDPDSRRKWFENSRDETEPSIDMFLKFLDQRCEELELGSKKSKQYMGKQHTSTTMVTTNNPKSCYKCNANDHILMKCPQFLSLTIDQRRSFVKVNNLCFNCLSKGHSSYDCKSGNRCKTCKRKHHTLTHQSSVPTTGNRAESSGSSAMTSVPSAMNIQPVSLNPDAESFTASSQSNQIFNHILPTAVVGVRDYKGNLVHCRVLLDTASELSYITESCIKRLGIRRQPSRIALTGISSVKADTTNGHGNIHIRSRFSDRSIDAQVHVLNKISSSIPRISLHADLLRKFENVTLADPTFYRPSEVDILLGAGYVWDIFTLDRIRDHLGNTIAVSSLFGWVVTSVLSSEQQNSVAAMVSLVDIDRSLRAFWEIEECPGTYSGDDSSNIAEEHFKNTHRRDCNGKYIVELPFIEDNTTFADTCKGALVRFNSTERRLSKNLVLRQQYIDFMREYQNLGHMRELSSNEIEVSDGRVFYLPHHPIIGKKLRVVFDGSFTDSDGTSLNSKLHIGSPIQRNLFAVCLRFRFHRFVFAADIVKMFRQVWVSEHHRNFQRILWRENPDEPLRHFQLCTVTYGTASAPFLAVRVLEQIARDHEETHPNASRILLKDFYVDDVVTGASSESELHCYRDELVDLLSLCGINLSKWMSNATSLAERGAANCNELNFLQHEANDTPKVLGIYWNPDEDIMRYKVKLDDCEHATKRRVLSDVARIFDPLGLVSPVVVKFKILFQELWLQNLTWDDPLPQKVAELWRKYRNDLFILDQLKISRFVIHSGEIHLHGFCDASTKAYSAVVYCRSVDDNGRIHVSLIASKTRVAPLKQISLPRLELCGALLLTRLMKTVATDLEHRNLKLYAWCDSTIVLSWLSIQPVKLKTFVANRTSEILDTLPRNIWNHVRSKQNPADCASRGIMAEQLLDLDLWWKGPTWLTDAIEFEGNEIIPAICSEEDELVQSELKNNTTTLLSSAEIPEGPLETLIKRTSSWSKLLRVTAYLLRFVTAIKSNSKPKYPYLTYQEIDDARTKCLMIAQNCFHEEIKCIKQNTPLPKKSKLWKLSPYLDDKGLLRVGGRIDKSDLPNETRHPIILPKNNAISKMILREEHVKNLHPGVSSMFVIVRQRYWILGARNLIRKITHECLKCFRYSRQNTEQRMADLPSVRVLQSYPFENAGCDYAGPFTLKLHRGRNSKTSKGYICLFVCLVTSAIHLELVSDLSTDSFLSALRIFMARRGKCSTIYSDNGKNFVGGKRKLDEMYKQLQSEDHNIIIMHALAKEGIKWNFIPPYSPHWGGMWESAVRSVKLHLKRVVGATVLTFEQMRTLLAQIEAVVNSRPLTPTSDTQTNYLSPSHFLIGRPTTMVPEGNLTNININRLDYWQHVQSMYQGFWKRWSQEYLTSLQQRPKWAKVNPNLEVNDLVIVKEDNIPPATWITGRIIETFPGKDGLVRVVKLRTSHGEMTRPISKLVKLPIC